MGRLTDADADALQKDLSPQLTELAEAIGKKANATAVFGSPIVDGDRTVIPVAQARFGLGLGDGLIAKGVGGGMTAKPLGFIVIDKNGVRFQKTPQPSLALLAIGAVLGLALATRLGRPPRPRLSK
ncbi:MAG TPA: spore germination protein GerW family protein [Roseiarcus sp.]|nr:spore germination protein GerW family protein [Roseiarcus sp.]